MALFKDISIRKKLARIIFLITGVLLFVTSAAFFTYEFYSFRKTTVRELSSLGQIIAANSTAALAFDSRKDAGEILAALRAEQNIVAACIYDRQGHLFSYYSAGVPAGAFPDKIEPEGYRFTSAYLEGFQPIAEGTRQLGTLYLKSDLKAMYSRFALYGLIVALVIVVSLVLTYLLSRILQNNISKPILMLAKAATSVSSHGDYSVRAKKFSNDELGALTDAFNKMLEQIEEQNHVLSEFNQTLEQKVLHRTSELEILNKELESFSYSISHDLRAPLRAINGYMTIFSEDYAENVDNEGQRLINVVLKNSNKMGLLIDDLLAFSKLGRKDLSKKEFSMKDAVLTIWEDLHKMESNRSIELVLGELPNICAEKSTIQQVWVNLLSNALKYSRNKEKTIITIASETKDKEIIYSVKDNGAGFDMKYYNKLFGVFQRLHSVEEFDGTGVGLAIVQRIIEKHDGKIWADSELNKGATFYFSLPA